MSEKRQQSILTVPTLIFGIAAVIALPLRTLQFFTVLEAGTGFYSQTDWSVYALYGVLGAAAVALIITSGLKRKQLAYDTSATKRMLSGLLCVVAAGGVLVSGIQGFVNAQAAAGGQELSFLSLQAFLQTFALFNRSGAVILGAEAVFAVLTAVFFAVYGIGVLTNAFDTAKLRLLSLMPVVWGIFRIVFRFMRTISFSKVSDLLFELFMLSFLIMFFMAFAQVNAGINAKNLEWKLVGYGLPCALMCLVCFVPRFIVTVTGNADLLYEMSGAEICDLAVVLFIFSNVFTRVEKRV